MPTRSLRLAEIRVPFAEHSYPRNPADGATAEPAARAILDSVSDAIIVVDGSGAIQWINRAAERLFGYSGTTVTGRDLALLLPSVAAAQKPWLSPAASVGGEIAAILAGRHRDGRSFPLELAVNPIAPCEGAPDFVCRARDLSERQRAERRVQELQAELLHMSRATTMGQMASTLAHELNQPLAAIANYLRGLQQLVRRPAADPKILAEAIDKSMAQVARAAEVIRRLREFVSKGDGETSLEPINPIVEETVALARVASRTADLPIFLRLAPDLPQVRVDKLQLQQAILNLVANAAEAMRDSKRRELTLATALDKGGAVQISIADTGPGIDPEIASRIFDPFVTTKKGGMGLGLSLCREIAEAHGGSLAAAPNLAGGSVFTISLPAAAARDCR